MMKKYSVSFNVHNIFRFRVFASHRRFLASFEDKFAYFLSDDLEDPDIDIFLGRFELEGKEIQLNIKDAVYGRNFIQFNEFYKILKWKIAFDHLESKKWDIYCYCNLGPGYETVITKIIRPLFSLKLALEGKSLLHGSAVAQDGEAFVLSAFPGVGKSSFSYFMQRDSSIFLADENILFGQTGTVYSFPLSMPTTTLNLNYFDTKIKLSPREYLHLKFGDLVQLFSRGFLEKSFPLHPEKYFRIQDQSPLGTLFIMGRSPGTMSIREIDPGMAARFLFLINDYELMTINKHLLPYFLINRESALQEKEEKMLNNYKNILRGKTAYYINLDQNDMQKSFEEIKEFIQS